MIACIIYLASVFLLVVVNLVYLFRAGYKKANDFPVVFHTRNDIAFQWWVVLLGPLAIFMIVIYGLIYFFAVAFPNFIGSIPERAFDLGTKRRRKAENKRKVTGKA